MIKKLTAVIDDFLWLEDDTPEEKASYYKFGVTMNVVAVALFVMVKLSV
ncbi:hypothetical protein MHB40_14865 [Lysinibacillus sp. FSL K6-0057]